MCKKLILVQFYSHEIINMSQSYLWVFLLRKSTNQILDVLFCNTSKRLSMFPPVIKINSQTHIEPRLAINCEFRQFLQVHSKFQSHFTLSVPSYEIGSKTHSLLDKTHIKHMHKSPLTGRQNESYFTSNRRIVPRNLFKIILSRINYKLML